MCVSMCLLRWPDCVKPLEVGAIGLAGEAVGAIGLRPEAGPFCAHPAHKMVHERVPLQTFAKLTRWLPIGNLNRWLPIAKLTRWLPIAKLTRWIFGTNLWYKPSCNFRALLYPAEQMVHDPPHDFSRRTQERRLLLS
ncbi:hypothetical protein T484DRAFT_2134872 [Baffinella frigidus]|nr:hypothetical protein T484DRAFT_2134872 [Cryptophyta sp. CCMP2293]